MVDDRTRVEPSLTLLRSDQAVFRRLAEGQGGVLLHLDTAAYHGVNEFGAAIWERLSEPRTFSDLLDSLADDLTQPPSGWRDDVRNFVAGLVDRGLVLVGVDDDRVAGRSS